MKKAADSGFSVDADEWRGQCRASPGAAPLPCAGGVSSSSLLRAQKKRSGVYAPMKIHIQGGTLIDPAAGTEQQQDIFIEAGEIAALGNAPAGFQAERTIDARGLSIAPGLVDLCARLREPGYEHKATLGSEMAAALAGGVTSLVCPPDTDPTLDEPGLVEMLKFRARNLNKAHDRTSRETDHPRHRRERPGRL